MMAQFDPDRWRLSNNPMAVGIVAALLSAMLSAGVSIWIFDSSANSQQTKNIVDAQQNLQRDLWTLSSKLASDERTLADQGVREDETNHIVGKFGDDMAALRTSMAVIQSRVESLLPPPDGLKKR